MAGLADLDADARSERGGQAELRAEHAENQRIAAPDKFDAAAHTHTQHFETLRFLVVGLNAPHDGAYARRQHIQANQLVRGMVNCCQDLCKISFPAGMSNTLLGRVDAGKLPILVFPGGTGETPALPGRFCQTAGRRFFLVGGARILENAPVPGTVYFDYNATTPLDPAVREAMLPFLGEIWGNPSSVHHVGRKARSLLDDARDRAANFLGAKPSEIIFTSGGTESNNLAILGAARSLKSKGRHLITSAIEHHAVLQCFDYLEKREGFEVSRLQVDSEGWVSPDDLKKAIRPDTVLVSVMAANNEIGTIQPVAELGAICRDRGVVFHTDAVQWFGKEPFENIGQFNADLVSVCAHKFHGPKGAGLLFVKSPLHPDPILFGGGHENEGRAGTENLPGIIGLVESLERFVKPPVFEMEQLKSFRAKFIELIEKIDGCEIVSPLKNCLKNTISFIVQGAESIALLAGLDVEGICASSGSACSAGSLEPSHVVVAIGRADSANSLVRFSLGRNSSMQEVNIVCGLLPEIIRRAQLGKQPSPSL
jgi:cysteine desulfurase